MSIESQTPSDHRAVRKSILIDRLLARRLAEVRERVGTLRAEQAFLATYMPNAEPGSQRWDKGRLRLEALRVAVTEVNQLFEEVLQELPPEAAADATVQRLRLAVGQLHAGMPDKPTTQFGQPRAGQPER